MSRSFGGSSEKVRRALLVKRISIFGSSQRWHFVARLLGKIADRYIVAWIQTLVEVKIETLDRGKKMLSSALGGREGLRSLIEAAAKVEGATWMMLATDQTEHVEEKVRSLVLSDRVRFLGYPITAQVLELLTEDVFVLSSFRKEYTG